MFNIRAPQYLLILQFNEEKNILSKKKEEIFNIYYFFSGEKVEKYLVLNIKI